jgi:TetR/AcrR family transcriptional regulator, mexJK operon transcriptional repressor
MTAKYCIKFDDNCFALYNRTVGYGTEKIGRWLEMELQLSTRAQKTREQIRAAAQRLFLQQGYLATSTDAILAEAGIASKETLYRHYASKEELFADVLRHITLEQPRFATQLSQLPAPQDLPALRQALTTLARELLSLMLQPEYQALVRVVMAEMPRFPQLGRLYRATVPERGLLILTDLLRQASERGIIANVDFDALTHALLGGLIAYALFGMFFAEEGVAPPAGDRADAVVDVLMHALARA